MNLENKITDVNDLPIILSVEDLVKILGLSKKLVYDLCHSKKFPSVQIGKRIIISKIAFVKWLENPTI